MKYAVILAVLLSAFYIGASQLVLAQLDQLKGQYQNADAIAQAIAAGDSKHR